MAITYTDNGGGAPNGSDLEFTYSFPVLQTEDVKVALNGVTQATTKYAVDTASNPTKITFNNNSVDSSLQESNGAPKSGVSVRVYRRTTVGKTSGDDDPKAVFAAGSSIRAVDLNANTEQGLYAIHELQTQPRLAEDIADDSILSSHIKDGEIVDADINASADIANTKIADGLLKAGLTINSANIVNGSIVDEDINATANIQGSKLANDSVALTKLGSGSLPTDITVSSTNIVNGTIVDADVNVSANIQGSKLLNDSVTLDKLGAGALPTDITIASANVVDGSIVDADIATGTLDNRYYTKSDLDGGQLDNRYYTEVQLNPLATNPGDNVLDARYFTETESDTRYFRQDSTETIASGDTWSGSDLKIATTGAIDLRVIDLIDDVGGFVPIANETSFPTSNPDVNNGTGTIVSITAASTDLVPSGTTVTIANGRGSGLPVDITNVPETIPSGYGFLVETKTTAHEYTFHRLVPKATEVSTIAANAVNIAAAGANVQDIHNFADLYQISTSAPTTRADSSNLVAGDLWYDSSSNKVLMIYDGSSGDGFTAATPNASDLANIAIVAGQITFTEDLGLITNAVATATGNTTLNTVAGIATEAATVAGIASDVTAVAADATDIGVVAGKATEIGRLGTADAVADMNTLGTTAIVSDMDTLADISSDITTVAGIHTNVSAVSANQANINAVNANATNINAVNANSSNINTVSGINADVTTVAGISSNVTAVAGNASNINAAVSNATDISAVAGNNSNISAVAGNSSNINSAVSNASNINSAVSNASNINSAVSNATNINTVAGVSSNVTTVAGSIANVNTAATNIANINTTATNIADVNTFANRYRIDSSDPGSNNDQGDLYFNTTSNELRVYNGSTWQGGVTATGNLAGLGANTFTGAQTFASGQTFDGRDVSADGAKLDAITTSSGAILNGVTATTQSASDNSTKIATTAYTDTAIANLVDSSPNALNTLNELAAAIGDDANFSTTVTNSIATKLPLAGGTLTGTLNISSGNLQIGGTNVLNSGRALYNLESLKLADNKIAKFGSSDDLEIYHDGSNSYIKDSGTGNLFVHSSQFEVLNAAASQYMLRCISSGSVELYEAGDKKFETTSTGATITGSLLTTGNLNPSGYLKILDGSDGIYVGTGNDLQIFHDGNNSVIREQGAGHLYFQNGTSNILSIDSAGVNVTGIITVTGTVDGRDVAADGSKLDTYEANGSSYVRSDANDSLGGLYDFTNNGNYPLTISGSSNAKILLSGATNPYIQFREGSTSKCYIQWNSGGYLHIVNEESSEALRIGSGSNGLVFVEGGSARTVWHAGNDGSGSGLDADTVDGLDVHTGRNNEVNKLVRTDSNGYIQAGWINTTSGDIAGHSCTRFYASDDSYIRYVDLASMRARMNTQGNSTAYAGREDSTSDRNYWVGSCGYGSYDLDSTLWRYGSCFWDAWSNPSGQPSGSSHWQGMQAMHYTDGVSGHYGFRFACGSGNPANLYVQGRWNTTTYGWHKLWNAANDGSGSGLDADKLDGVEGSSFLRSDTADTISSTLTMGTQAALVANGYGHGVYGVYSSYAYQHVWSMGTAYNMSSSGSNAGNIYGLTWTHTNVGTGTNQAISGLSHQLQVRLNGGLYAAIGNGIWTVGNITAYSDIAVKRNLVKIPNALEKVSLINGYTYERTDHVQDPEDPESPEILRQAGVVAQEIEKVLPEVVSGQEGNKSVAYGNVVALLIEAIKELKAEVDELKGGK